MSQDSLANFVNNNPRLAMAIVVGFFVLFLLLSLRGG
jgi:hypothetical protein